MAKQILKRQFHRPVSCLIDQGNEACTRTLVRNFPFKADSTDMVEAFFLEIKIKSVFFVTTWQPSHSNECFSFFF